MRWQLTQDQLFEIKLEAGLINIDTNEIAISGVIQNYAI